MCFSFQGIPEGISYDKAIKTHGYVDAIIEFCQKTNSIFHMTILAENGDGSTINNVSK